MTMHIYIPTYINAQLELRWIRLQHCQMLFIVRQESHFAIQSQGG